MKGGSCGSHLSHPDEGVCLELDVGGRQLLTGVVFHRQVAGMEDAVWLSLLNSVNFNPRLDLSIKN